MRIPLILFLISIPLLAQPPLPPPIPGLVVIHPSTNANSVPINVVIPPLKPARTPAFTVNGCPHCGVKQVHVHALAVETNGWHRAEGRAGNICERTIHMVCHNPECGQQYTARNEKFVSDVIAVEEPD